MPQPITKVVPDAYVFLNIDALKDKPEMALLVTKIFATWARIEQELNVLLVTVLGADATPAIAMYSTLIAQHLQLGALDAAAKAALSQDDYQIFKAVMATTDSAQTPRNHLAHWSWASCKQRPDLLALADPKMLSARDLRVAKLLHSEGPVDPDEFGRLNMFDEDGIIAYSKPDLERALRDLTEAHDALKWLTPYLDQSFFTHIGEHLGIRATRDQIRERSLAALNGLRLFREALARIRGDQKNNHRPQPAKPTPAKTE